MSHSGLYINTEQYDGTRVVSGRGYLDLSTRLKLSTALNELVAEDDRGAVVVVDLSDVTFIDSSGLGALLNALRRLTSQGREMRVVCPLGHVRRIFELAGLENTFKMYDSRENAL